MRKTYALLLVFIFIGNNIYGQDAIKNVINNGNLNALDRLIEINELLDLSQNDLRILRNTIYAKYGYIFRSADLQKHFSNFLWYHEKYANVDDYFSLIDKENIKRIQDREHSLSDMITFQNTTLSWIESEKISLPLDSINIDGIVLYQNPALYQKVPKQFTAMVELGVGLFRELPSAFCFAMGRFLNPNEVDRVGLKGYALVFNPSVLFLNTPVFNRAYRPFEDDGIFLIAVEYNGLAMENVQANQIKQGFPKSILILPWSVSYYVYKISNNGELHLVDRVAAN